MTTFQDPPPQSRRAVRQSERGENPSDAQSTEAHNPFLDGAGTPSAPAGPQTGRRARAGAAPAAPAGEPLTYATQNRVSPPAGEQFVAEPLATQPPPVIPFQSSPAQRPGVQPEPVQPQIEAPPLAAQPAPQGEYRVRDFSPEGGRRSAINREQAAPAFPAPADLDYHTQGAGAPAASHAVVPEQQLEDTVNHTLSRRELREMRAAQEQAVPALKLPESIDTLLNSGPIDIPTLAPPPGQSQALAEAMAEFDLLTRSRREAEAKARDAQVASLQAQPPQLVEPSLTSVPFPTYAPPASVPEAPAAQVPLPSVPVASVPVAPPVASAPAPVEYFQVASVPRASVPVASVPIESVPVESVPVATVPVTSVPVASVPIPVASAPVPASPVGEADAVFIEPATRTSRSSGHWSAQVDAEDDELPFENTLSRTVGSNTSAITTSALVLPSVPQPDGLLGSIGTTGEILITGSIDLPRSLASTGAHPGRIDNSDFEDDPLDSQVAAPDSAPVRAIRAVSTHTSTRGVIDTKLPQSNKMLTAVIITASVLCVGVIGFLIFAFATNKL